MKIDNGSSENVLASLRSIETQHPNAIVRSKTRDNRKVFIVETGVKGLFNRFFAWIGLAPGVVQERSAFVSYLNHLDRETKSGDGREAQGGDLQNKKCVTVSQAIAILAKKNSSSATHNQAPQTVVQLKSDADVFVELENQTKAIQEKTAYLKLSSEQKENIRFAADKTVSLIPEKTAISLPNEKGKHEKRFHGNIVQLHENEPEAIATQAPKHKAMGDFWLASFLKDSAVIVDLTQPKEIPKRADIYYPKANESLSFGEGKNKISVTLKSKEEHTGNDNIEYCIYEVNYKNETKTIGRVHYKGWQDHSGTSAQDLRQLVDFVDKKSAYDPGKGANNKLITVHCSAGVGRTGTFLTARTAKHQLTHQDLSSEQIRHQIIKMGLKGREQRNPAFIQKDGQVQTLIAFMKELQPTDEPIYENLQAQDDEPIYANVTPNKTNL